MAHTTIVPPAPVSFVADPSFPLLQGLALCDSKRVEFGFLPPTVSYLGHFIFIFRDGHKLHDGHDGVLFLLPYSVRVTATTHFSDIFLCLSQTPKSIEVWTSNQFLASIVFTVLDYHDLAPLQSLNYRSTFDLSISFPLALLLKCRMCFFQWLFNEFEEVNGYGIDWDKDIAQLWLITCWTRHLELEVGPTITIFYYVHSSSLPFTTYHYSSYSWDEGYVEARLFLLLMLTVTNQILGILLFGDSFAIPSIYLSFSILMIKPHKVPNMLSSFISVFDPGISVRASCLVEAGAYFQFPCWSSCLANIPSLMKFINECTATWIGALTWDTIFSKSLWCHYMPSFQSHARFPSKLITWLNATFIEPYTYFISDVLKWGLQMHKNFVDYRRLYVGALIIATVMLLYNGMADLPIISGSFLFHFKQRDLLRYFAWAYEIVENAGSTGYVDIITIVAILIVVFASCFWVMLYKLMSFCIAEVLVVLICIGGIEGLQTCLVVLLSCFHWFQPTGQTFVKVLFLGVVSYFTLSGCIGYINGTIPHISKVQDFPVLLVLPFVRNHYSLFLINELQHYGLAIGNWCLVGANLHLLFSCSVVVPETTLMRLISAIVLLACLANSTWNSLDFPTWQVFFWVIVQGWYFRIISASSTLGSFFFSKF